MDVNLSNLTNVINVVPGCAALVTGWLPPELASSWSDALIRETAAHMKTQMTLLKGWPARPDPGHRMARFGSPGVTYSYKGKEKPVHPFTPKSSALRDRVAEALGWQPNCAVINTYEPGSGLYPHRDGNYIPQLGDTPIIVSVSFGASRTFLLHPADP